MQIIEYLPISSDGVEKYRIISSNDKLTYFFEMIWLYEDVKYFRYSLDFPFYLREEDVQPFMHSVIKRFEEYCSKIQENSLSEKILKVARIGRDDRDLDIVNEITFCLEPNTNKDHLFKLS